MDYGALIELVRKFEFVYNKKHPEFKNKSAKENAWNTIAKIMERPREEVETTWNSLRNRYVTEKRKIRCVPSGSGADVSDWRFFSLMNFLQDHVVVRKTCGNVSEGSLSEAWNVDLTAPSTSKALEASDNSSTQGVDKENKEQIEEAEEAEQRPEPSTKEHNKNKYEVLAAKKQKKNQNLLENKIAKSLTSIENILQIPESDDDEDSLFAKSITQSLRLIKNRKRKARAKINILSILEEYEED